MRWNKLNTLLAVGLIAIIGVVIMQLRLLKHAYDYQVKDISNKIHFALQDVVRLIYKENKTDLPINDIVKRQSQSEYLVNVNNIFDQHLLGYYLKTEFEKMYLDLDYEYAIYDCKTDKMVYVEYVKGSDHSIKKTCKDCFVKQSDLTYYFGIRFPGLNQTIITELNQTLLLTVFVLLTLIIYVYSAVLLIKQKRYTSLQTDFINNMTHEFKTPISSLLIAVNYISKQNEIKSNKKLKHYLELISNQSKRLNTHVEQILKIAKVNQNKRIKLNIQKTSLNTLIEEVKNNILTKYPNQKSLIVLHLTKNLHIQADKYYVSNLFYNIIDNAFKYSTSNLILTIESCFDSKYFNLTFKDNGIGIPKSDIPFIFDKFYRVERSDNEAVEGFGIGLSFAKLICDAHKWKLSIKNNDNKKGVCLTIKIPKSHITND